MDTGQAILVAAVAAAVGAGVGSVATALAVVFIQEPLRRLLARGKGPAQGSQAPALPKHVLDLLEEKSHLENDLGRVQAELDTAQALLRTPSSPERQEEARWNRQRYSPP